MAILKTLLADVKGDVVTPENPEYRKAISRWATNAERNAKVVVFVKDTNDIALALRYAKENNLPVAVRGGGHSSAGASSVENGLVIDLSRYLHTVRVDPEARLGYVGGGAVWKTVDVEAIKYGLATVGGTVNHVGRDHLGPLSALTYMSRQASAGMCKQLQAPKIFWLTRCSLHCVG